MNDDSPTTEIEEELFKEQYKKLREFFHAPLRFSHNYGQIELRHERLCQTIDYGKELLPGFSEDRILEIARKPLKPLIDPEDADTRW